MTHELEAFASVDFEWTRQLRSVWRDPSYHVESIHKNVATRIIAEFKAKTEKPDAAPLGQVVVGVAGSGKTHLIGSLRQEVWRIGGWFVLLDLAGIKDFWASAALCFVESLNKEMPGKDGKGRSQYQAILMKIVSKDGFPTRIRTNLERLIEHQDIAVRITRGTVMGFIKEFLVALDRAYPREIIFPDVVRACLLLILGDWDARNIAYGWLQGIELFPDDLEALGFGLARPAQIDLVRGMSWLMSLAGPTLIGIDQIDAIVSEANLRLHKSEGGGSGEEEVISIVESLAGGLMQLHDVKYRAMTVVSCLDATWRVLQARATVAVTDRFLRSYVLDSVTNEFDAAKMIEARLAQAYAAANFTPPYPTWPFAPRAFAETIGFSPRQLLKACDDHRLTCLARDRVFELQSFRNQPSEPPQLSPKDDFEGLYETAKRAADLAEVLEPHEEDGPLSELLIGALDLFIMQTALPDDVDLTLDAETSRRQPLHGRLTFTYHSEGDRERHYCFRVLSHSSAIAFQARLKAAMTASGVDRALPFRHLFILRRDPPPKGAVTARLVEAFKSAGGKFIAPSEDDLRALIALRTLRGEKHETFPAWLRARRPLCELALFKAAGLCGDADFATAREQSAAPRQNGDLSADPKALAGTAISAPTPAAPAPADKEPVGAKLHKAAVGDASTERAIAIGRRLEGGGLGRPVSLAADLLPRHTAILAGSGSGKTVLLRRMIEEAALLGIPSIVLDANNDLVHLASAWPEAPSAFSEEDAVKATLYARRVEVTIWTPGLASGRPMTLSVLPDFAALGSDPDERCKAVEMASATLLPFIGANKLKAGVLADALRSFAEKGGGKLPDLIALLGDLPEGVSAIGKAMKHAADMADQLRAAIATNPLLAASGAPLNPQALFGDPTQGKTRVSVINLSGLGSDESRQSFVNQLQMTLFTWIKNHPSPTGRLYALDEAQNFAPSQKATPCKESTLALAAQARKYGLGMIFATQAPKGIDNKIVSNCTTHFYGKMNSPATIDAVRDLIAAKGGGGDDVAGLSAGVFYFSTEGTARPIKLRAPWCLTYHPKNPIPAEEVARMARP